jgi:hypothetical protein
VIILPKKGLNRVFRVVIVPPKTPKTGINGLKMQNGQIVKGKE